MQRATRSSFYADTQFKDELHHFPHPPSSSFSSSVTAAAPAKKITFYKSGDAQFKGIKMAIHKRSFKCFDALLDDLSQKVSLPFGVRTITTPRGIHSIKHLEQLVDGGCYLCSDRRYVKPINMEAAGKRPAVWQHHSHPHNARRKPSRPEEAPSRQQHYHRHPKKIVLVKNNDPAVRRSIILSRRTARSLRVFMEEISELMQCHVKKLYTLEGHKIDSIQSLMQCPSVLVCVGREPFRPLLTESVKKLSDERLPGMGTRSQSSIYSEGYESKKNVNFGLKTKKSIIHPRSDSSNRSTRFSLSSEKSYQNGLCMTPGQSGCVKTCPYVKELVVKDDIEKRVLVNKDGSLSIEMKVRFSLFNDETLQWSTEIKKSSTNLSDNGSVKDAEPHYLQAKAEYSDPESIYPSETEEAFVSKLLQKHLEESHCQNCCNCQEYDIWKNPMHKDQAACKSASSSGSSLKIVHKKSSVDSTQTISRSSEECTEHEVEKALCFEQSMEEGDTRVEYCTISHCCSQSEVSASAVNSKSSHAKSKCSHMDIREPDAEKSPMPHQVVTKTTEERPISVVSSSSKVLESFKEDQDDDYDDLPPSISRASHWSQKIVESKRATSAMSKISEVSGKSKACSERSIKSGSNTPEKENGKDMTKNDLTVTSPLPSSKRSPSPSRPRSTHMSEVKETNSRAPSELMVNSKVSSQSQNSSKGCCHSSSNSNLKDSKPKTQNKDVKDESVERVASRLSGKSKLSAKSHINNIMSLCNQLDEPLSPTSTASVSLGLDEELKCDDFDERSTSGMSATREDCGHKLEIENGVEIEDRSKKVASVNSANSESKSKKSHHINCKTPDQALSLVSDKSVVSEELKKSKSRSGLNENNIRVPSALSVSSSCSKSPSSVLQGSAKNTATKGSERACEAGSDTNQAEMTEMHNASNKMYGTSLKHDQKERASGKATPVNDCLNAGETSKHSVRSKNDQSTSKNDRRSKSSPQCLEINCLKIKCDAANDAGSAKSLQTSKSDMISVKKVTSRPNSVVMSDISQNCRIHTKNKASVINTGSSSDSTLSRALSAADLLREIVDNVRPVSRESKSITSSKNVDKFEKINDNKSDKSSQNKHRKVSETSERNNEEHCSELMPSCLPNSSPTEVVKDWLRNIPTDGPVYEMDVELTESITQTPGDEDASQQDKSEPPENIIEIKEPHEEQTEEIQEENHVNCVEKQVCEERLQIETSKMDPNPETLTKKEGLQKQCHSSVQVMKVLLGPKLDRCNSLPEISPVYGRKLSQSAQGLLDCLVNLRLIDSEPKKEKHPKYNEVMMILQSLWLQEPSENKPNIKEHLSAENEFNPRSSSGVDVCSGSTGSVKCSMSGIVEKSETIQGKIPPIAKQEASLSDKDEVVVEEDEEKPTTASCEGLDPSNVLSDPITPDIAERVQGSPKNTEMGDDNQENIVLTPATKEDSQSTENKNESDQTPLTSFNKSSGNESYTIKSTENTSSGTPPSVQRASLIKRVSQDPDPIWVLSLLKKLEKQFMLHYADAMAEFKVRWDLDDNEMLNMMIRELKDEVHKRIQSSIHRELQKIQGRAGKGPRPPENALSRESTVQTEQRRKRLRVMRNKSISLSRSDENYTASGTDYSNQRIGDEYCPCDVCMKKKMASRVVQRAQALSLAPVMKEFDLRKILQMKKDPAKSPEWKMEEQSTANTGNKEENNLEVVHEDVEEVKDNRGHISEAKEGDIKEEAEREAKDNEHIQEDASADHETKDEETNDKKESSDEDDDEEMEGERDKEEENGDGEVKEKEEVEIDEKAENAEEEEVELGEAEHGEMIQEEAEKEGNAMEEECEEKDGPEGDIEEVGNAENSDTAEDEDEDKEENMETAENGEMTETGEETESGEEGKAPEEGEAETETGDEVNVEKTEKDKPAADEGESKSDKDDTSEGEKSDENEPPNKESTSEKNANGNYTGSAEDKTVEDRISDTEEDEDQLEKNIKTSNVNAKEEVRGDPDETDKQEDLVEDFKPDKPDSEKDKPGKTIVDGFECTITKQITRISMESQPGSMGNCTNHVAQAKLKDLHSFMESTESHGDNMVVITKQAPYKDNSELTGQGNQKDIGNGFPEWEVSPKIRNRAIKQKKPMDNDILMNGEEF
ncbi:retinitis pigmentosa 1-like 1 protein [Myxocyprinus asiaticus]|uniref:retinitis pigmentosa 1-like 1 protein n=1 Tax=Myxocyprinus asiaticus TaxID=70543 RepID=UPI0022231105|nr:retinitis pigmentosa 1-like 1 protein [Myxocyprinus asiaticus]